MKKIIVVAVFFIAFLLGLIYILCTISNFVESGVSAAKNFYMKPDTSIVIHNGKPDTTIKIKSVPSWLK